MPLVTSEKLERLGIKIKSRMASGNYMCWCPFHEDKHPSFAIHENTGLYICFACGEKGSWKNLVYRLNGPEEFLELSSDEKLANISFPKDVSRKKRVIETLWEEPFLDIFEPALHPHVLQRGFPKPLLVAFGVRWDPKHRQIIVPVRDYDGRLVGVVRRQLKARPKYIIDGYKRTEVLFGLHKAERGAPIIITEGIFDALRAYQFHYSGVALQGTTISMQHIKLLSKFTDEVWVGLDNDSVGQREQKRVVKVLRKYFRVFELHYPEGIKDFGDVRDKALFEDIISKRVLPV